MALQGFIGFENLSSSDLGRMSGWGYSPITTAVFSAGRLGGSAMQLFTSTGTVDPGQGFYRVLTGTPTTVIIGAAINIVSLASFTNLVFGMRGSASTVCTVQITTAGLINILDSAGAVVAAGTVPYVIGTWYYLELRVDIIAGLAEIRRNGVSEVVFSGSLGGGNTHINRVGQAQFRATVNHRVPITDDWYILDGSGAAPTSYLGDSRVVARTPTSDASVQFAPSGVGGNFAQVDEATENGDTDYVATGGIARDRYLSNTGVPGNPVTIHAVGVVAWTRKTDSAVRAVRSAIRSNLSDAVGPTQYIGTEYTGTDGFFALNPNGNVPWSAASVNSLSFGPQTVV